MNTKITLLTITLSFFIWSINANAQAGSNDNTFNSGDVNYDMATDGSILATAIQSDGKILIGGAFTTYNGTAKKNLVRVNADGGIDASFNIGTGADNPITSIAIQSDGKIIIGGKFASYNGTASNGIARLNTNGSYDAAFIVGTGTNSYGAVALAIQTDGQIIFGGTFTSYNGTALSRIGRLNTNGSVDATFNSGTGITSAGSSTVYSIAVGIDGKIAVGGAFLFYNGVSRKNIALLNADGTLNTTFLIGAGPNNDVDAVAIQSDGKVIIGGLFNKYNNVNQGYLARLNTDGTKDPAFVGAPKDVDAIAIQADGKVLFGGWNNSSAVYIGRRNTNGSADYMALTQTGVSVSAISVQSDGKIIVSGNYYEANGVYRNGLARLNINGSVDKTFNRTYGAFLTSNYPTAPIVYSTSVQNDGKIIIGGDFLSYNDTAMNYLARANADGSVDPNFVRTGDFGVNSIIRATGVQSDGKIIAAGEFLSYNGLTKNRIIRFLASGSIDPAFNIGTGANSTIYAVAIQSDGKIIIAGSFATYNGIARSCIARLNTDGTLDAGFIVGTGANSGIFCTAIQGDGKIIIGGSFTTYNGTSINRLARLNTDGSLDPTFIVGTGANNYVEAIAIQPGDGKVIIGGYFSAYNGTASNKSARINTDGSYDAAFVVGTGFTGISVDAIALQSNGNIIFGGNFTQYKGITIGSNLVRINTIGSIDASFNVGVSANGPIKTTILQSDEKLIIAGSFTGYNGAGRHKIARVITSCTPPPPTSTTVASALDICTGSSTALTATVSGTSGWYDAQGAGNYLGGGTSYSTPTLTGTTTYYVQDSNSCGPSGTRTAITVNVAPIPSISGTTPGSRCDSGTVILGATANTGTLNWYEASAGGPSLGSGLSFTTPVIYDTANYYVATSNICGSSARTAVKAAVRDLPVVTLSVPPSACRNASPLLLTGGSPAGGTYYGTGVGAGNFNPLYLGTNTITYTYSDGICSNSATQSITVNALPNVFATADFTVCALDTISLAGGGATTYVWNHSVTNATPFVSSVTNTTYIVTGTDIATGCSNIDSTVVTVSNLSTVALSLPAAACLNAVPFILTGGSPSGGIYSGIGVNTGNFNPAIIGAHAITYTYSDGTCSQSAIDSITVNALPIVTATADFSICAGDTVTLAGNGATTYVWDNSVTNATPFISSVTTTYNVIGTDIYSGCSNTASTVVTVNTVDTSLSLTGNTFTANAAGAAYKWLDCISGSFIPGETNQSFTAAAPGAYALEVTQNGCKDTSACYTIVTTGISETNVYYVSAYPNPSSGKFQILISKSTKELIQFKVTDILGKQVYTEMLPAGINNHSIDLSQLPNGIYLLQSNNLSVQKLIIQK